MMTTTDPPAGELLEADTAADVALDEMGAELPDGVQAAAPAVVLPPLDPSVWESTVDTCCDVLSAGFKVASLIPLQESERKMLVRTTSEFLAAKAPDMAAGRAKGWALTVAASFVAIPRLVQLSLRALKWKKNAGAKPSTAVGATGASPQPDSAHSGKKGDGEDDAPEQDFRAE